MTDKPNKTKHKGGRPSAPKQTLNEKKSLEYYEDFKSAGYAAKKLGLNRQTVEKYYQKFRAMEIEETNTEFIQRQRAAKAHTIEKLDEIAEKMESQINRVTLEDTDYTTEGVNQERLLQKSLSDAASLYQQKADMEMTPTLDIHIDAEIEKKYGEYNEANAISKQTGKPKGK